MGVTDWEPRALPSEARCQRWYEQGGRLLVSWTSGVVTTLEPVDGAFCAPSNIVHVRPWKDNNPATWSDFFTATHPPIPDGWEKVGEWYACGVTGEKPQINDGVYTSGDGYAVPLRRILPAIPAGWEAVGEWHDTLSPCSEVYDWTLLQDGRIIQRGETFRRQDERIMGVHIRRVLPDVDWGDVPRGVELDADRGGAMLVTSDGHAVTHGIVWFSAGVWHSGNVSERADQRHPSLPAAIVALTGRRNE